ncbi:MAG TPA: HAD-IIIA family hydrolase [Candidatus Saccharimonadales bacterium]
MKTVFLDRDGTIIVDPKDERVDSIEKIELFPDSIEALKYLADHYFNVVIVSNQAGIAEGRISEPDFWKIHSVVLNKLSASGIKVLKTYMNGEAPGAISNMRKPAPGMLLQAAKDFSLNLSEIYIVGDSQSDIEAGINAGCKGSILVKTATNHDVVSPDAIYTAKNLLEAVHYITDN